MANVFAFTLAMITIATGIIWCFKKTQRLFILRTGRNMEGIVPDGGRLKKNSWVEAIASVFPVLFLVFIIRSFIFEPFQIPSGSMMPTLLVGDFILVEKFAYGIKLPVLQTTIFMTGHPKRGDTVVFIHPKDPYIDLIKRVVGLPGDKVTYDALYKTLSISHICNTTQYCDKKLQVTYSKVEPSDFTLTYSGGETGNGSWQVQREKIADVGLRLATRKESLGRTTHNILLYPEGNDQINMYYKQQGQPLSTWIVPPGEYFVMGDNRDNSDDSRYWGFVPENNLIGKATAIWMSFEKQEGEFPTGLRLKRIGLIN